MEGYAMDMKFFNPWQHFKSLNAPNRKKKKID